MRLKYPVHETRTINDALEGILLGVFGPRVFPSAHLFHPALAKEALARWADQRPVNRWTVNRRMDDEDEPSELAVTDHSRKVVLYAHSGAFNIYHAEGCLRAKEIIEWVKKLPEPEPERVPRIHILVEQRNELRFVPIERRFTPLPDLLAYYNDDFAPVHQLLLSKLSERESQGLVIMHGAPGTGKTSYLRQLCALVPKRFLYVSSQMANWLTSPSALPVLLSYPDSILILEDADEALSRRGTNTSAASNILNITDGFLNDALRMPVICTFNSELRSIDPALLRPGRLIARYEFAPLTKVKANALLASKGLEPTEKEATLAELLGSGGDDGLRTAAGFKATMN